MGGQLAPDALAPRVGRERGDPGGPQAEPRARGGHVGFGASDLEIELVGRLEPGG